jgi:hypothetical protein
MRYPAVASFKTLGDFISYLKQLNIHLPGIAVSNEGRANPNQLLTNNDNLNSVTGLRNKLFAIHRQLYETTDDLIVGLQLTHSGRGTGDKLWIKMKNLEFTVQKRVNRSN